MRNDDIIIVNERDEATGTMGKLEVHEKGILHRAFSIFIMNSKNEMLLHKRSKTKYHTPGLWTNACCSHPSPGESYMQAAHRRLMEELGFDCGLVKLSDFIYHVRFENGLTEYEFDHVLFGIYNGPINPNPDEICEYKFLSLCDIEDLLNEDSTLFTPWFRIAFSDVAHKVKSDKMVLSL